MAANRIIGIVAGTQRRHQQRYLEMMKSHSKDAGIVKRMSGLRMLWDIEARVGMLDQWPDVGRQFIVVAPRDFKRVRDAGLMVGVSTHMPAVIDAVESKGWDVDFYAGCAYNLTRSDDEWRRVLDMASLVISASAGIAHPRIGIVNRWLVELFNLDDGPINIAQIMAPDQLERARQMIAQKLADPTPTSYELEIAAKDGRRLTVEINSQPPGRSRRRNSRIVWNWFSTCSIPSRQRIRSKLPSSKSGTERTTATRNRPIRR